MLETNARNVSSETPWGLSWDALFASLRPSKSEQNAFSSTVTAVTDALATASFQYIRLVTGGALGKGTMSTGESTLHLYAIVTPFSPARYFDDHLKPILDALASSKTPRFAEVRDEGLAVCFAFEGISVRLFAAAELAAGPKQLLVRQPRQEDRADFPAPDARALHVATSCAVLRVNFVAAQPPMYKDLVRVAKKWRQECKFMAPGDAPGDYLVELVMLEAFQGAPCAAPSPDLYATIFRRFLALAAAQSSSGSDVVADDAMPNLFLSWTTFYNQGAIDQSIASGLLKTGGIQSGERSCLVVVDPAAPFVNVANTLSDWSELRRFARDSLAQFQNSELLESLQTRLNTLSEGMQETLTELQAKLDRLQTLEESPRRWSGMIQFREAHMSGDAWTAVTEVKLRTVTWRINARRARTDGVGYSSFVDVSLQMIGKPLPRTIDVDVHFRSGTANLVFDANTDHVLFARRSEVIRNRDYAVQITVVA